MGCITSSDAAWLRQTRMGDAMSEVETPAPAEPAEVTAPSETDWKAEARKWESRAKESNQKAKENEEAASRLAQIEEANKTEAERQSEELARLRSELETTRTGQLRAEVAAAHGLPVSLLSGSSKEELEASAEALIAFRGEPASAAREPLIIPGEGNAPLALNGSGLEEALKKALGSN
jgi:exonuclease VII large subunit